MLLVVVVVVGLHCLIKAISVGGDENEISFFCFCFLFLKRKKIIVHRQ